MPWWVVGLILGTLFAVLLAVTGIAVSGLQLGMAGIAIGYAAGFVGTALLLADRDGENDETRVELRAVSLRAAMVRREVARRSLDAALAKQSETERVEAERQAVLQSEAYKRRIECDRLLAVEAGRLYPDEFERHVGAIFRHLGFEIEQTGRTGDQGVDVLASKEQLRIAIQAKRYIGSVGNAAVQEVFAGMVHHRCQRCAVVTTSGFTSGAIALAQSTGCLLIGSAELPLLIRGEIQF